MNAIDQVALERFGSLLDDRENAVAVVAGTYSHSRNSDDPIPIALMVTDQRIVVGGDNGAISVYAYRDRRHRIEPLPAESSVIEGSFACGGLTHMFFPLAARDLLDQVDRDAAQWDQIVDDKLGVLTADEHGLYRMAEPPEHYPAFLISFDGSLPGDVLVWAAHVLVDPDSYVEAALTAAVAQYLPLKNESWLSDGEAPLSESEFRRRLTVKEVSVPIADRIEIFFDDGAMFGHHSVVAHGRDRGTDWEMELFG